MFSDDKLRTMLLNNGKVKKHVFERYDPFYEEDGPILK